MVLRKSYLDKIIPFIDQDLIKVLVGIRRCGKTVLLGRRAAEQLRLQHLRHEIGRASCRERV